MKRFILASMAGLLACALASAEPPPSAGDRFARGFSEIGAGFTQAWHEVRQSVENMGVQGRVYGRLHWDKDLHSATFNIDVRDNSIVVLKGRVDSMAHKEKAEQLARDTAGVERVIDELRVEPK